MDYIISWLQFFGITPQQITPVAIIAALLFFALWKFFLKDIKEEVTDLHHATKEIQNYIKEKDDGGWNPLHPLGNKPIYSAYGVTNSPTLPNEKGKKLLKDSGFDSQYPKFKDKLFALMDVKNLRTLYDYEKGAMESLKELQNDSSMDKLKEYSVNHPDESLELIFQVASWIIRDDYAKYSGKKKLASAVS